MTETRQTDRGIVVASIRAREKARWQEALAAVPAGVGLVELRADDLDEEQIRACVRDAGRDLIVTVRRREDGGGYDGPEAVRRRRLEAALEAGAAWIDVELDRGLKELASGPGASRTILSHHGGDCEPAQLRRIVEEMAETTAGRWKVVPVAQAPVDVLAIRSLLDEYRDGRPLAAFAMGRQGAISRLLACAWGSWGSYGHVAGAEATAPGQYSVQRLLETFDVTGIGPGTRLHGLIGSRLGLSPSPAMHTAAHRAAGRDARLLPLEIDEFDAAAELAAGLGLCGMAVTMPFKIDAAARCAALDPAAEISGSVNTVRIDADGWKGFDTDGPAVVQALSRRRALTGDRVVLLGAGGVSRAIGAALISSGARVTLFHRDEERGRRTAAAIGAGFGSMADWPGTEWDVLVNATPLGRNDEPVVAADQLGGSAVVDVVYRRDPTPLALAARERGLLLVDGMAMLVGQARLQIERLEGSRPDARLLEEACRRDLEAGRVD